MINRQSLLSDLQKLLQVLVMYWSDVSVRRIQLTLRRAVTEGGQGGALQWSLGLGCVLRLRLPRRGSQSRGGRGVAKPRRGRVEGLQVCPFGRRVGDSAGSDRESQWQPAECYSSFVAAQRSCWLERHQSRNWSPR
jgi:hypothetical protein